MRRFWIALLLLWAGAAHAQPRVSVLTVGQGDAIWEQFGHNFLVVEDPATGRATAYNWGVFDFAAPDFLSRFLTGDTRYWMEANSLASIVEHYPRANRSVAIQHLRLTAEQTRTLVAFLQWNAREENRYYRYDYFRDNCSTRLRDALDRALGGALRQATARRVTTATYRSESVRLTETSPLPQLGIAFALGQPADQLLSAWEASFVPMRLQEYLRDVRVRDASGAEVPLVTEERVLFQASRAPEQSQASSLATELAVPGLAFAVLVALLGRLAAHGYRGARLALAGSVALWGIVAGIAGLILLLAWTSTQHVFWFRNENLFHYNPLALALPILVPFALRRPRWWRAARGVALIVAALSVAGAVMKMTPFLAQQNWALVALALPVNVAVAWAVAVTARRMGAATA